MSVKQRAPRLPVYHEFHQGPQGPDDELALITLRMQNMREMVANFERRLVQLQARRAQLLDAKRLARRAAAHKKQEDDDLSILLTYLRANGIQPTPDDTDDEVEVEVAGTR